MSKFTLSIMDFSKVIYSADVTMLIAPSVEGDLGILSGHAPLVAQLSSGCVRVFEENKENCETEIQVGAGFLVMNNNLCEIYCFDTDA